MKLWRPVVVRYEVDGKRRLPTGEPVTKATPGAVAVRERSRTWRGRWGPKGREEEGSLGVTAKSAAEKILAARDLAARLDAEGVNTGRKADRSRPLADHAADYLRSLANRGNVTAYVAEVKGHLESVFAGCHFVTPADLDPDEVEDFLAGLRADAEPPELDMAVYTFRDAAAVAGCPVQTVRTAFRRGHLAAEPQGRLLLIPRDSLAGWLALRCRGVGVATSNHYLRSVKGFSRWLDRRTGADPLRHLGALNAETDRRRLRRALTHAEVGRLLEAARAGPTVGGLEGCSRRLLYHTALRTGLRAGELASLTPRSFTFGKSPTVTVAAAYSKHRREDTLPLLSTLAAELRPFCATLDATAPVWPGSWADDPARCLRVDLQAAQIPYVDDQGRVCDFHALRHSYIQHLIEAGVHPKTVQLLARHSSIGLTMDVYGKGMSVMDAAGDLERLAAPGTMPAERGTA